MPLDQQKNQWCVINSMQTLRVHSCLALQRERHDWQDCRQMVCADMDGVRGCFLGDFSKKKCFSNALGYALVVLEVLQAHRHFYLSIGPTKSGDNPF